MVRTSLFVSFVTCGFLALMACETVDADADDSFFETDKETHSSAFNLVGLQSDSLSCLDNGSQNSISLNAATDPKAHSYSFVAEAGQTINYTLDFGLPSPANIGAILTIYDAYGATKTKKTSSSTPKLSGTYTFVKAGTYYFTISPYKTYSMKPDVEYQYDLFVDCLYCAEAEFILDAPEFATAVGYSISTWDYRPDAEAWIPQGVSYYGGQIVEGTQFVNPVSCKSVKSPSSTGPKVCGYLYDPSITFNNGKPYANKYAFFKDFRNKSDDEIGFEFIGAYYQLAIKTGWFNYTCPPPVESPSDPE